LGLVLVESSVFIFIVLVFVGLMVPIIAMIVIAVIYESSVEKQFIEYSKKGGHQFIGEMARSLKPQLWKTHLTSGNAMESKFGVMHNVEGKKVTTALWYNIHKTGKGSVVYTYQIASMPVDLRNPGEFIYMRKEKTKDKLASALGYNDIDFEHHEFSEKYFVHAKPERFGFDFFHPRMIQVFLDNPNYGLIYRGGRLIVYKQVSAVSSALGILYFLMRKYPQIDWMKDSVDVLLKVEKSLPSLLKKKKHKR
jgi:hypothetical protein